MITGLSGTEPGLASIGTWHITNPGVTGSFSYDGAGGVDLVIATVPEPSASLLMGGAIALLGSRRRRRAGA